MIVGARTHLAIDPRWSGEVVELAPGSARVRMTTRAEMAADEHGLVHGGFVFAAADLAAMMAVNEPNVVLASSETSFLAPVGVGQMVEAVARVVSSEGRRFEVAVEVGLAAEGGSGGAAVARGTFHCVVTRDHVLAPRRVGGR